MIYISTYIFLQFCTEKSVDSTQKNILKSYVLLRCFALIMRKLPKFIIHPKNKLRERIKFKCVIFPENMDDILENKKN